MNVIRLRYRISHSKALREHLHVVDGTGYFFFPDRRAQAPTGLLALLEVDFIESDESLILRGLVWSRPAGGGLWLEIPSAARILDRLDQANHRRENRRLGTEQLVVVRSEGQPSLLCRMRDLSAGGARLASGAFRPGDAVRIAMADSSPLALAGTVVWSEDGALGLTWDRSDAATRSGVLALLESEDDEWSQARSEAHSTACRCVARAQEPLVLLG